jgi:hypothetical protein
VKATESIPFETYCGECGGHIASEAQIARVVEGVETNPQTHESEHVSYYRCHECQHKRDDIFEQGLVGARIRRDKLKMEEHNARRTRNPY